MDEAGGGSTVEEHQSAATHASVGACSAHPGNRRRFELLLQDAANISNSSFYFSRSTATVGPAFTG
jgi:hypothetical protein